jgi:hypothetical protein
VFVAGAVKPNGVVCVTEDVIVLGGGVLRGTAWQITVTGDVMVGGDLAVRGKLDVGGKLCVFGSKHIQPDH